MWIYTLFRDCYSIDIVDKDKLKGLWVDMLVKKFAANKDALAVEVAAGPKVL